MSIPHIPYVVDFLLFFANKAGVLVRRKFRLLYPFQSRLPPLYFRGRAWENLRGGPCPALSLPGQFLHNLRSQHKPSRSRHKNRAGGNALAPRLLFQGQGSARQFL